MEFPWKRSGPSTRPVYAGSRRPKRKTPYERQTRRMSRETPEPWDTGAWVDGAYPTALNRSLVATDCSDPFRNGGELFRYR